MSSPMARASASVSEKRFAETAGVLGDQARGGGENVRRRAIVAFEADDLRAGEVLFKAQDVVDLGAAPAVDRLIVVADAADIRAALRQEPQPQVLRDVGVLVLVDEDVAEAAMVVGEHVRMLAEEPDAFEQQIAKVAGVEVLEARLIGSIEGGALACCERE